MGDGAGALTSQEQAHGEEVPRGGELSRAPFHLWRHHFRRTPPAHPLPLSHAAKLTRADAQKRDKIKYSKWKAADIAKAFREGRTPIPGPAGGLPADELDAPPAEVVDGSSEERALAAELAALDSAPPPATEPEAYPFPVASALPLPASPDADPDGEEPTTPAFPSFLNTPTALPGSASPSPPPPDFADDLPSPPATHQTAVLPPPASTAAAFPAAVFPSAPPILPPVVPTYQAPPPPPAAPRYVAPTAPAPTPTAPPAAIDSYDPIIVAKIQKHAKWAVSALNYDDYETARKELRLALAMLGG